MKPQVAETAWLIRLYVRWDVTTQTERFIQIEDEGGGGTDWDKARTQRTRCEVGWVGVHPVQTPADMQADRVANN